MNLPNRHTQNLLDCLTRSRLSFALYRLPWTDECYFVLQTSDDVEQLAEIQELNGKKGFVMAPFLQSDHHPLVVVRPDITAYDWNEISEAISSLECADALLTCKTRPMNCLLLFRKKQIRNDTPKLLNASLLPFGRNVSKSLSCHVLPPGISMMTSRHWPHLYVPATIIRV